MQSGINLQSNIANTSFQGLLLEEFILEPNLRREFGIPEKFSELALHFSDQAATILHLLIVNHVGLPIPSDVIKEVINWLIAKRHTTLIFRSISDIIATVRSEQDKYNSCCRSAICHGVVGSDDFAFGALRIAASVNNTWARHHHIYGVIHGIKNCNLQAQYELEMAYNNEPYSETKARIQLALEILK
ncbi:hypothetical protein [Floridanema aerugineum]|uniref:Uncharacterized protein n=1 Tax=Floridaenema aerugineum BLCC-F46 TaxID=3153654 RepID=A0ABV4XGA7_9CYAN